MTKCTHLFILLLAACCVNCTSTSIDSQSQETQDTPKKDIEVDKALLTGKYDPSDHEAFVLIPEHLASRSDMYLQKVVLDAFTDMYEAASEDGIQLKIISATRNFDHQKRIWGNKFFTLVTRMSQIPTAEHRLGFARDILRYSSMPGTSRHHWGTDIDINALEPSYFESGKGLEEYEWLKEKAQQYGFCQPYTSKDNGRTGYEEEKWHWSYTPLSGTYLKAYNDSISYEDICCFEGDETAEPLEVIKYFVNGVDTSCIE